MTVCIAAKSDRLGVIVTVSDTMLSDDVGAMDVADFKTDQLLWNDSNDKGEYSSQWFCLYSGRPVIFGDLSSHIKRALAVTTDHTWSASELMHEVENAYDAVINRRIEREF
jgi:hypothetical protein